MGGRFHEFAPEAREAGLKEAMSFSPDGTVGEIRWDAFRHQTDRHGRSYMDHAKPETFEASKLDWQGECAEQQAVERLFRKLLAARTDARVTEDDPLNTRYKAWKESERAFLLRRRAADGREFLALFNLGLEPVTMTISADGVDSPGWSGAYLIALDEIAQEGEWPCGGRYTLWLDTNDRRYGGNNSSRRLQFDIQNIGSHDVVIDGGTALVLSIVPTGRSA